MSAASRPKKPVSDRRRQQNVRAQKKYRERQKRHIETLEALLGSRKPNIDTALAGTNSLEPEFLSRHTTRLMLETNATPLTEHIGDRPRLTAQLENPSQTLRFLVDHMGDVDESTSARVESGDITIRDILAAGLEELSLQRPTASNPKNAQESAKTPPVLRTDKILIPKKSMLGHPHPLPNIYANHLRIKQFSTIAAFRANAELLGLTFEEITNPATESPLFSGAIAAESGQARQFAQLQVLKPDLRPTDAQTQFPHHPYVDLIPCPVFRQRFIHLASMDPPMFDEGEFCLDLGRDGLICWGSYTGSRNEVTGSGAPWDIRSWEAQPWFLKKWWLVLGGAEGGFFQQSRWWHEVRGERLPYVW